MIAAPVDDRLTGSYPLMTMVSVLVAGWLMARQLSVAERTSEASDFLTRDRV